MMLAAQESQPPTLWTVPGAYAVLPGPGQTVYVVGSPGRLRPTRGAWDTTCSSPVSYGSGQVALARVSYNGNAVAWSTCIPFQGSSGRDYGFAVDPASGDLIVAGTPSGSFRTTPDAITGPRRQVGVPGEEIGIVRVRPDGSNAVFAALIASNPPLFPFIDRYRGSPRIEVLPDGTIFLATMTAAPDFPVTADAIETQPGRGGYLLRISADGSRVVYGSYLHHVARISDLAQSRDGRLWFTGLITGDSPGYPGATVLPLSPGTVPARPDHEPFLARFDPATARLDRFARLNVETGFNMPTLSLTQTGNPVLAVQTPSPGARLITAEIKGDGSAVVGSRTLPMSVSPGRLRVDSAGNWLLAVSGVDAAPPVTVTSASRSNLHGAALLRLSSDGQTVLTSTRLLMGEAVDLTETADGTLFAAVPEYPPVTHTDPAMPAPPGLGPDQPVSLPAGNATALFYALPDTVDVCDDYIPPQSLMWDVRDVAAGARIEIRRGDATGEVIATGATGSIGVEPANASYTMLLVPGSGPFGPPPRVLATETTKRNARPLECFGTPNRTGSLTISPNPVLACRDPFLTGTSVGVTASRVWTSGDGTAIHVLSPSGPLFLGSPDKYASGPTGDWVRNGMEFFGTEFTGAVPFASRRAYVLPVRDCRNNTQPQPAIAAVRDCADPTAFTLAYFHGIKDPVEIRRDTADGPVLARLYGYSGLVTVRVERRTTLYLTVFSEGKWAVLASTVADPAQRCEQGQPE